MKLRDLGHFIYEIEGAFTPQFCEAMIAKFEGDDRKVPGMGYSGVDLTNKQSTDLFITDFSEWLSEHEEVIVHTDKVLKEFSKVHPKIMAMPLMTRGFQMQRTKVGEFFKPHYDSGDSRTLSRQLVLLWYLNTVDEGGETNFPNLNVKVKPKQGKLLLFPPFWTHIHEGLPPVSNIKYVLTTWIEFN